QLYAGSRTEPFGNPAYPKVSRAQPPSNQAANAWAGDYASNRMDCPGRDARSLNCQRPCEPIQRISEAQPTRPVGKSLAFSSICRTCAYPTASICCNPWQTSLLFQYAPPEVFLVLEVYWQL